MANEITDNLIPVDVLLKSLAGSCLQAAHEVSSQSATLGPDGRGLLPVRYVVPSFTVNVKLSFTRSGSEVKGLLFWKRSEGETHETLSNIEMQIVAVPAQGSNGS